mmetsp:Transcript_18226/g.29645  ORF Transcript_18226/g.29645 Transcript_18226/m.29645 type:complete len:140 (+) Transcript_18226:1208-1627(+)
MERMDREERDAGDPRMQATQLMRVLLQCNMGLLSRPRATASRRALQPPTPRAQMAPTMLAPRQSTVGLGNIPSGYNSGFNIIQSCIHCACFAPLKSLSEHHQCMSTRDSTRFCAIPKGRLSRFVCKSGLEVTFYNKRAM